MPTCLPNAFETACDPLDPVDISFWKICLPEDSTPTHATRTTRQFLAEFLTPADWTPFSQYLNPLDFSIWSVLQAKVQAMSQANPAALRASMAMNWDQLAATYICKTCHSFCRCREAIIKKN